ncbi:MAG: ATP-binding protein [Fidelibacterota bacterium]
MKFKRILIRRFKSIREKEIHFQEEINIIEGLNEKSKTHLREAIIAALFYEVGLKDIKSCKSWREDLLPYIELEYTIDGSTWLITKDFQNKSCSLTSPEEGIEILERKEIQRKIEDQLGFSEELYYTTARIAHDNIADLKTEPLKTTLQRIVTSGKEDISSALKKLDEYIKQFESASKKAKKNPLNLKILRAKHASLIEHQQQVESENTEYNRNVKELEEKKNELQFLKKSLDAKKTLLKKIEEIVEFNRQYDSLKKEFDNVNETLERVKNCESSISTLRGQLRGLDIPTLRDELKEALKPVAVREERRERNIPLLVVGLFILLIGILSGAFMNTYLWFLSPIGLSIVVWALVGQKRIHESFKVDEDKKVQLLNKYGAGSVEQLENLLQDEQRMLSLIEKEEEVKKALLKSDSIEQLESKRKDRIRELAIIDSKRESVYEGYEDLSPEQRVHYQKEIESIESRIQELGERIAVLSDRIKDGVGIGEVIRIQQEVEELSERIDFAERKKRVAELLYRFLSEARNEILDSCTHPVKSEVEKLLARITAKKYSEVEVTPELVILVHSRDKGDLAAPEELSRGTRDQIYLSARFGLIKVLSGNRSIPLLLDDSLVHFDPVRKKQMWKILEDISSDYQILYFTTDASGFKGYRISMV